MKTLAGTRWGANGKILRQVYTGAVRPVMEYASTSWITASKTTKTKLDKVQNTGLRTILGAMKTTPITEMEKTADLEPLDARREFKTLVLAEEVNRLPTHKLHTRLNSLTKNRLKRQSLNHTVKSLRYYRDITARHVDSKKPNSTNKGRNTRPREKRRTSSCSTEVSNTGTAAREISPTFLDTRLHRWISREGNQKWRQWN